MELYYNLIGSDRLRFYVHAGGEAEFCVSSRYTLFAKPDITVSETVRKLQYSVGGGVASPMDFSFCYMKIRDYA